MSFEGRDQACYHSPISGLEICDILRTRSDSSSISVSPSASKTCNITQSNEIHKGRQTRRTNDHHADHL